VELIEDARSLAVLHGDEHAALRLGVLADRVEAEAEYSDNVAAGLPLVRRRELPPGCTIGYLLRYCAVTRANRRALGVHVPDVGADVTFADIAGVAA